MSVEFQNSSVLLRRLRRSYPLITHGKGVYLYDDTGKDYLDAASGALVASVGHGNSNVVDSIASQLKKIAYVNGTQFTTEPTERLAGKLSELTQSLSSDSRKVFFLNSGSEAIEAAIKFARQVQFERGKEKSSHVISRSPGYHGNTLFALSISGRPHYKKFFGPLLHESHIIETPYRYRSALKDYATEGTPYHLKQLEKKIETLGAKNVCAFILEPIVGPSAGASIPPLGYLKAVQELCERYEVITIADEVLCGAGRTGTYFASEQESFNPDVVVLGKGLGGGYAPLSAVLVKTALVEEIKRGSGNFMHAQTYLQAPFATAAGSAVLSEYESQNLVSNAMTMGDYLHEKLAEKVLPLGHVGHLDGRGLLAAIEIIKEGKTPFPRSDQKAEKIIEAGYANGLTLWPHVGQVNDQDGDIIAIGPPLCITQSEIDVLIDRLVQTLKQGLT